MINIIDFKISKKERYSSVLEFLYKQGSSFFYVVMPLEKNNLPFPSQHWEYDLTDVIDSVDYVYIVPEIFLTVNEPLSYFLGLYKYLPTPTTPPNPAQTFAFDSNFVDFIKRQ